MNFFTTKLISLLFLTVFLNQIGNSTSIQTASSGDWNEMTTWKGGKIPTLEDDITLEVGHIITVNSGESYCKSLIINGIIIIRNGNLTIGEWGNKIAPCLVNGKLQLEGDYSHQLKINGYLRFNMGSKFIMTSGALNIDGTTNTASKSVAANQALLDIGAADSIKATGGAIIINNPHFHVSGVCIKGAKKFDNTIVWGNNIVEPVTSPNDFVISETEKPIFTSMRLSFVSYPNKITKLAVKDLDLLGLLNVNAGNFYASGQVKIAKDLLIGENVDIEANIEMNGSQQQNVFTYGTNKLGTIKGNFTINNADRVGLRLDLEVKNGRLIFKQGKLELASNNLILEAAPSNAHETRYIITHSTSQNMGKVLIKNIRDSTIFPMGTERIFSPLYIKADSGDFQVSISPLSISAPTDMIALNNQWKIERLTGKSKADIDFQWTTADESTDFSSKRTNCNIYRYDKDKWTVLGSTVGITSTLGTLFSKKIRFVDTFSLFTVMTSTKAIVSAATDIPTINKPLVFPNPIFSSDILYIKTFTPIDISIYDITGKIIEQRQSHTPNDLLSFKTDTWAKGIYIIHTVQNNIKSIQKVIKQ